MTEPRRVQLACLPPAAPLHPSAPKRPPSEEQEAEPPTAAAIRITLTLFEPDHKRCPEFCYPELLRNLRGSRKKGLAGEKPPKKVVNLFDEAERKEVAEIAQKFEEKYGCKKRNRDRMQDLLDMGYGYDESDSFIDNSEAYDELVPASLTTRYGGFYINSGTLQFRQASESEDDLVKEKKKKSPKKMKERGDKAKKKKRDDEKKCKKTKYSKPGFTALNGMKDKKKKKHSVSLSEMLQRFQREKAAQKEGATLPSSAPNLKPSSTTQTPPPLPPPPPREAEPTPDTPPSSLVPDIALQQAASATDALGEKELENLLNNPPEKQDGGQVGPAPEQDLKKPPSIPDGLPVPLERRIKELTKAVKASEGERKTILFTQEMNSALLDIHLLSRDLTSSLRSAVFTHLSSILPCSKDTLVKWASRLHLHKQGGRLREPLRKLKEAVARAMPEQISKYHEECQVHNQAKYAKMLEEDKEKEQRLGSEDEEEEEKGGRKQAGPRKKFQWNEEIRQLLCQLVRIKVDMYEPERSGMQSLEDYLKSFLDADVKPLWPRGWMQARTLYKESRHVYQQLGSIMLKNKAVALQKVKVKDSSNKHDKKAGSPPTEAPGAVSTISIITKDTSVPTPTTSPSPSRVSPLSTYTQDNSLDGDLIHNPPSLDTVSEHLTALASRSGSLGFDFPSPRAFSSEKPTTVEEKRKPCLPPSSPTPTSAQQSPRGFMVDQSVTLVAEKKLGISSLCAKPSSDVHQGKQKQNLHGQAKPAQLTSPILQPSVKLYQISSQHTKGSFPHPTYGGSPRSAVPSAQRPLTPQAKPPSKSQSFHPTPSSPSNLHKPLISPGFVGKHPGNASTGQQVYRPQAPRHPAPASGNSGSASGQNPGPTATLNPSPSLPRNPTAAPAKKPSHPPQKLTLVAPQDSGGGTQGVAKLLTSSMVARVGGSTASPSVNCFHIFGVPTCLWGASSRPESRKVYTRGSTGLGIGTEQWEALTVQTETTEQPERTKLHPSLNSPCLQMT
ncbi:ubinuclein-1 isoform X3 [Ascaphus truei]|uniref:ubinuclein-1 isoform X3 n=1 Tax=Ascaphus truei TaxID=8439 RepID=UPI003F5AC4E1